MSICYPSDTDWGCAFTEEQLTEMRDDPLKLAKMKLAEAQAWYTLAALTAYRIGVCPTLVRPVAGCGCSGGRTWMEAPVDSGLTGALPMRTIGMTFTPYVTGGQWVNGVGCGACGWGNRREVVLPGPIGDIEWVNINGEVIDRSRYRVDNGNILVSIDPELIWPSAQSLNASVGDPDTFAVSYYQGVAPNELVHAAAGALAAEFYKLCTADKNCRFPRRVKQVTRGNATYEVDVALFTDGLTRIPEADFLIRMLNPNLLKQAPRVSSPASRNRPRRQTWGQW